MHLIRRLAASLTALLLAAAPLSAAAAGPEPAPTPSPDGRTSTRHTWQERTHLPVPIRQLTSVRARAAATTPTPSPTAPAPSALPTPVLHKNCNPALSWVDPATTAMAYDVTYYDAFADPAQPEASSTEQFSDALVVYYSVDDVQHATPLGAVNVDLTDPAVTCEKAAPAASALLPRPFTVTSKACGSYVVTNGSADSDIVLWSSEYPLASEFLLPGAEDPLWLDGHFLAGQVIDTPWPFNVLRATSSREGAVKGSSILGERMVQARCPSTELGISPTTLKGGDRLTLTSPFGSLLQAGDSARYQILLDGVPVKTVTSLAFGTQSITLPAALAAGQHTVAVAVQQAGADEKGNPITLDEGTYERTFRVAYTASGALGDQSGDKRADIMAIDSQGNLLVYPTVAGPRLADGAKAGAGWGGTRWVSMVPDLNRDGWSDLLAIKDDGTLWLYRGAGMGRFGYGTKVGQGWSTDFDLHTIMSDTDGNGLPELLTRRKSDGALLRYPVVNANGQFGNPVQVGHGWDSMVRQLTVDDFSGDGRPDLLAINAAGDLYRYTFATTGTINGQAKVGQGWAGMSYAFSPGDLTGDGRRDMVGRTADGTLLVYPSKGTSWGPAATLGTGWAQLRWLF